MRTPILLFGFFLFMPASAFADLAQDRRDCARPLAPQRVEAACTRLQKSKQLSVRELAVLHHQRGNALRRLKHYRRAIAAYDQAARLAPARAQIVEDRGRAYAGAKQYRRALEDYGLALRLKPERANTHFLRGVVLSALTHYQQAIADFDRALALKPNFPAAYVERAHIYGRLNQNTRAIWDFNKAIAIDPQLGAAYLGRGMAYSRLKWHRRSIKDFNQAIRIEPNDAQAYYHRGVAHSKVRQYKQAIRDFDQAIRRRPKDANAFFNRAIAYDSLKRYQRAVGDYDQAIRLQPALVEAYKRRGLLFEKLRDRSAAISDYRIVLYFRPGDKRSIFKLKRLGASIAPKAPRHARARSQDSTRSLVLRAGRTGHFFVPIRLNGQSLHLLIDTGATATVFKQSDARRAGLNPTNLRYVHPVRTANGVVKMARVNIAELKIGGAVFWNVLVLISPRNDVSVLGVRTLSRFKSYTVAGNTLTLRW